jgi:hypothetical protein
MSDALRSDRPGEPPDRERDARIEQLLLSGLDHYFVGQYELAINVWTRVLFLDRSHARARAYIERARSALSERQREGDELLHAGAAALNRGERAVARQLLTSAVERAPSDDEALALLHRLDRLEVANAQLGAPNVQRLPNAQRPDGHVEDPPRGASRIAWVAAGVVAGVMIAALAGSYLWIVADPFGVNVTTTTSPSIGEDPLPVLPACEMRLLRARDLVEKGRLQEAAAELEGGDPDDRHKASMDELRSAIQRQLLARRHRSSDVPSPLPRQ